MNKLHVFNILYYCEKYSKDKRNTINICMLTIYLDNEGNEVSSTNILDSWIKGTKFIHYE